MVFDKTGAAGNLKHKKITSKYRGYLYFALNYFAAGFLAAGFLAAGFLATGAFFAATFGVALATAGFFAAGAFLATGFAAGFAAVADANFTPAFLAILDRFALRREAVFFFRRFFLTAVSISL